MNKNKIVKINSNSLFKVFSEYVRLVLKHKIFATENN